MSKKLPKTGRRNYKLGMSYRSRCGILLKIVALCSKFTTLEDEYGDTKTLRRAQLHRGVVWEDTSKYRSGVTVKLKCGVHLTVCRYVSRFDITVIDVSGNKLQTTAGALDKAALRWPFECPDNQLYRYRVGDTVTTKAGHDVTVKELLEDFNCKLTDMVGNEVVRKQCQVKGEMAWPFPLVQYYPKGHYVYIAHIDGTPYYIGSGKQDRYQHCVNGRSSSFLLNQHYFTSPIRLSVKIYSEGLDRQEALNLEFDLIQEHNPPYNLRNVDPRKTAEAVS